MDSKQGHGKYIYLFVGIAVGLLLGFFLAGYQKQPSPEQTLHQVSKDKIISAVANKLNYQSSDVVIGVPYIETKDWVSVNAGNKNSGGGMTFIFKKVNDNLELVFNGQECPTAQLKAAEEIPESVLDSGCK